MGENKEKEDENEEKGGKKEVSMSGAWVRTLKVRKGMKGIFYKTSWQLQQQQQQQQQGVSRMSLRTPYLYVTMTYKVKEYFAISVM